MITTTKIQKLINSFAEPINKVTYEIAGVETDTEYTVSKTTTSIRIVVIIGITVSDTVGNFKVYDSDGSLVCLAEKSFIKTAGKKQYIAFEFSFIERVI